jgi:RNA polymerase sigma factor (sigma-70 family)
VALTPEEAADLVVRAREGDRGAWDRLVEGYAGLVWAITRNHRLNQGDAADVSQTTWLRLVENIDRLDDPRRVGAWLATTARRECLRVLRLSGRHVVVDDDRTFDRLNEEQPSVDAALLRVEQSEAVREAFVLLPSRCQQLLNLLMVDEPPSYEELSAALGMPIGSIGPTRGRCLEKLRQLLDERDDRLGSRSTAG